MELFTPDFATHILMQYGSFALFGLLALGIIGLPIPDETLLVLAGFFIAKGKLTITATLIAALGGSILGISVSYLLGSTIGYRIVHKYGKWVGLTEAKLQKTHDWFEKVGKWILFFGYFIPGVRHLSGLAAGASKLEYKQFALFAYCGALVWSITFITIGYYFFQAWQHW